VRLTSGGSLDPGFGGGDGTVPLEGDLSPLWTELRVIEGDQPVAVVGSSACRGPVAFHTDASGVPLPSFGADGILYPGEGFGAIAPAGWLILKRGHPASEVVRIAPSGRIDRAFGSNGRAKVQVPLGRKRTLRPVGFDPQGRMLLVGSFILPPKSRATDGDPETQPGDRRGYLLVMRLLPSGKPDLTFGNQGRIATPTGSPGRAVVDQAALDPLGRLILLSFTRGFPSQVMFRYWLDGASEGQADLGSRTVE
jgi:hypothetical protein